MCYGVGETLAIVSIIATAASMATSMAGQAVQAKRQQQAADDQSKLAEANLEHELTQAASQREAERAAAAEKLSMVAREEQEDRGFAQTKGLGSASIRQLVRQGAQRASRQRLAINNQLEYAGQGADAQIRASQLGFAGTKYGIDSSRPDSAAFGLNVGSTLMVGAGKMAGSASEFNDARKIRLAEEGN
jgi:hypothetical protein